MLKQVTTALITLTTLLAFGAPAVLADSTRHFRHDDEARVFRATDPSGQLMVEWYYTGDHGDWVREGDDGRLFFKVQVKDAQIITYANVAGTFTPVGEGVGHLNVTSYVIPGTTTQYLFTDERLNIQSHGTVETFAGTWDFQVSVVMRDGEFFRLDVSPPPF